jgi:hypothetical protein
MNDLAVIPESKEIESGIKCLQCGSFIKKENNKFCNSRCMGDWRKEHWKLSKHPHWHRIPKICPICKKEFFVKRTEDNLRKCCSRQCYGIYKSKYHRGSKHPSAWKGGISHGGSNGKYRLIFKPDHPRSTKRGYVYEHILVAEKMIGKSIKRDAVVHHINGIFTDNRPSNLMIFPNNTEHLRFHREQKEIQ